MDCESEDRMHQYCPKCREEIMDNTKCSRCGTKFDPEADDFMSTSFDNDRYEKLQHAGNEVVINSSFDADKYNRLQEDGQMGLREIQK